MTLWGQRGFLLLKLGAELVERLELLRNDVSCLARLDQSQTLGLDLTHTTGATPTHGVVAPQCGPFFKYREPELFIDPSRQPALLFSEQMPEFIANLRPISIPNKGVVVTIREVVRWFFSELIDDIFLNCSAATFG